MILLHHQRSPAEQQVFPARGELHCPPLLCRVVKLFFPNENQQSTATQVEEHWPRPNDMIRVTSAVQHCVVRDTDPGIGNPTTPPPTEPPGAADVPSKLSQARSNPKRTSLPSSLVSLVLHTAHISGSVYQVFKEDWVLHQQ